MQLVALIVVRLLGTVCGLYGLVRLSAVIAFAYYSRQHAQPSILSEQLGISLLGTSALCFYACWLVWRRLSPMTVRKFSFLVGLVVWGWVYDKAAELPKSPWWTEAFGFDLLWPIALALTVGCLFSHVFRRALFPVVTAPSRIERFVLRR